MTLNYTWVLAEALTKGSFERLTTTWPSGRVATRLLQFQPPIAVLFDDALRWHNPSEKAMSLPIPPGPYSQSLTLRVPKMEPAKQPQPVDVGLTGFDATGRQVVCMQLVVPIK